MELFKHLKGYLGCFVFFEYTHCNLLFAINSQLITLGTLVYNSVQIFIREYFVRENVN